jgi:DNA primase
VAVLGFQGDVSRWAAKWGIEPNENWLGKEGRPGYISGLLGARRLVYPLMGHGRCVGFTARNILGSEIDRDGKPRKSYEMPVALAGEKRVYHNWLFGQGSEQVVVVEGPGDAVALDRWGCQPWRCWGWGGKNADTLAALRFYRGGGGEKCERTIYLGMDADEAGQAAIRGKDESWPFVNVFGVNARSSTGRGMMGTGITWGQW